MDKFAVYKAGDKAKEIHSWIEWIVMNNFQLSFVDNYYNRKNSKHKPYTSKTLVKYLDELSKVLETKLKSIVSSVEPKQFGIIFDGWTCDFEHYIAIFLTWTNSKGIVEERLICCGVQDEESFQDEENIDFTADSLIEYMNGELRLLGLDVYENIDFLIGGNCSTNKLIAKKITEEIKHRKGSNAHIVPLVGCRSHRLNLARKHIVNCNKDYAKLVEDCEDVMKACRTLKNASKLRRLIHYRPEKSNYTRWESTYKMLRKQSLISDVLQSADLGTDIEEKLVPASRHRKRKFDQLLEMEGIMQSVSLQLQKGGDQRCTLDKSRTLFYGLMDEIPETAIYLADDAEIVYDLVFETAVAKVQAYEESTLTNEEKKNS